MRRRVLSITIESFEDSIYADRPLPFGEHSRRLVAELIKSPHHYQPVAPPESLDAESIGAAVKQAVRDAAADVVIVHVVSHGKQWGDDVWVVGGDGRATPESSFRFWLAHAYGEGLPTDRVQDLMGGVGNYQRVAGDRIDASTPLDLSFLVNPNHSEDARFEGPPELRAYVTALNDLIDPWHFVTRAAGTTPTPDLGRGLFQGRGEELRRLTEWLTNPDTATSLLVTGSPGVGKSALLGMLVCAAHPDLREGTWCVWRHRSADLPGRPVTDLVAVHAREATTDRVIGRIGRQLDPTASVSTVDQLVELLSQRPRPPAIVIDAVDEAADPAGLVRVLESLVRRGSAAARLLIGSGTGPLWPATIGLLSLVEPTNVIDLDEVDRDTLRRDLTEYAADLLQLDPHYRGPTYAPTRLTLAATIGRRLTESAAGTGRAGWGEFLLAGLFINALRRRDAVHDPTAAQALAEQMPVTVPGIIDLDLDPHADPLARAVLTTLAYSFGRGLPRTLLRDCVPVFAGRSVTATELDDALDRVSFYLRRGVDELGVSTYRPFHHAITDHLGDPPNRPATDQARRHHADLLDHLLVRLQPRPDAPPEWSAANPYLLRHAIDHAVRAGRVDDLLTDPEFLVHADPTTLRHHLHLASSEAARANAAVYRTTLASQAPDLFARLRLGSRLLRDREGPVSMTVHVTGVHGIGNHKANLSPEQATAALSAEWQKALPSALVGENGLTLTVAYYAHHLAVVRQSADDGLDHLSPQEHEWLVLWAKHLDALPPDLVPQAAWAIPARMIADFIARKFGLDNGLVRGFVDMFLGEVHRYLNPPDNPARTAARATVADTITTNDSRVVIAHSLGTVVAYEALWTIPDHPIDLFITLGSPLGMPDVIFDRLQPAPTPGSLGQRPPNVRQWVNIADPGDIVAIPRPFTTRFAPDANHEDVHIHWLDFHTSPRYLASKPCVAALTDYLAARNG